MIGRRTAVGLSLLCALMLSAFATQSASAAKAVNTTAFTCVAKAKGDFSDSHCDTKVAAGTGSFAHEAIANDTTTKITFIGHVTLRSKAAGAAVEITCKVHITDTFHNVLSSGNKHTVTGKVKFKILECVALKPVKCVVNESVEGPAEFEGVEGLGVGKNEMGLEFKPEGGGTLLEITFANKGAEKCSLNGITFPVTGSAIATGAPAPTEKHTGATAIFTKAMTEETLKFGPEKASLEGATEVISEEGNPIALTTVT